MKDSHFYSLKGFYRLLLFILLFSAGCKNDTKTGTPIDELYTVFQNPPSSARPFVRWWWNGDCIEVDELERELDVMKAAGIGGVEINPIAHPGGGNDFDYKCYEWLSPEWNQRVKATIEMAKQRDMITDLIMGSGWPFGGEFLDEDQFLQGVGIKKIELEGPQTIEMELKKVWQLPGRSFGEYDNQIAPAPELFFLQMIPHGALGETELADLKGDVDAEGKVVILVPEGKHDLYIGTFQKAYRTVMHGAPGSKGPVVDHYNAQDVRDYMDKLAEALEGILGGKLGDHIRSLFCDSIELSGANITDDFFEEFLKRRGYDLKPFIPLVYYHPYEGYTDTLSYETGFNEDIRRIRYDFNKTLVELFLERFTKTFDDWANENGMQSRYQAYGMPWLVGMLDGYRIVDIPESNNWLYSPDAKAHGYWIWNKYCASGAHLSGARVVSSEAMTNTRGVFRMPLSMVKKNDDFNFISGINHSILHGYNYSPPEAGFPGWVRYGAYFSDQNTWWPYFRNWADYNARLSAVFQHSEPVVDVAILTPEADIWKQWGLYRNPFYMNPWYNHDLWEGFSRAGITADYINEGVIRRAVAKDGMMESEKMSFQMVIVSGAEAIEPETAEAIQTLARQGVKFLFIDRMPSESPSYFEKTKNDSLVKGTMEAISSLKNVNLTNAPAGPESVTSWADAVARDFNIQSNISLDPLNELLYVVKYRHGNHDIFFFSSQDETNSLEFTATFKDRKKTAWVWEPETGERFLFTAEEKGKLQLHLLPLQSLLIVLQDEKSGPKKEMKEPDETSAMKIGEEWKLAFQPIRGEPFEISTAQLSDFGSSGDSRIATFAGEVRYHTSFSLDGSDWNFLDLGNETQVTEVKLNGKDLGIKWWGRHLYPVEKGILKQGVNELEITYTTTLANYANSLSDNAAAKRWINLNEPDPMGLKTDIRLLK
ncbi:MAG: hypothetical protein IH594_11665 [Bacteroidales bacterium]|nr:hypothetical protein [Bacteroidales bacterium]